MLDNLFNMSDEKLDIKTEFIAGLTTFLAMSYVLGVNPTMLADAGMPATSVFFSTALAAGIACIVMGLISKYPVGLAPGMGMNALFTYTVVLGMGLSWNAALAAVFVSTLIFFLITITGLRETIVRIIPKDLKLAIGAGIGLFLAFIGLKGAGIIVADPANLVGLGALTSAPALLALIGILITIVLYIKKVPASVFIGLIITAIIGVIFTAAGFGVGGDIFMPAIPKEIISFSFDTTVLFGFASGFGELFSTNPLDLIMILFSFLFFIFFDTTGTLISLAQSAGFPEDENGEFKGIKNAFIGDAVGGLIGVILGTSPQTA
ncbi:MAG: NCS2 family permease, partial [Methanobrevibacter sp.]|nr:NCS2 family permease [Methanobrevibacter sp.]